jgi:hypothetical protein
VTAWFSDGRQVVASSASSVSSSVWKMRSVPVSTRVAAMNKWIGLRSRTRSKSIDSASSLRNGFTSSGFHCGGASQRVICVSASSA